jgi:hypothetical protein
MMTILEEFVVHQRKIKKANAPEPNIARITIQGLQYYFNIGPVQMRMLVGKERLFLRCLEKS